MRIPGFTCTTELGLHWIDQGTSARTRALAPAERMAPPSHRTERSSTVRSPTANERQVLTALDAAGITDRQERAMFLAQMSHESQDFRRLRENLHYSAERLCAVFPDKFSDLATAKAVVAQGTDAVAERLYQGGERGDKLIHGADLRAVSDPWGPEHPQDSNSARDGPLSFDHLRLL